MDDQALFDLWGDDWAKRCKVGDHPPDGYHVDLGDAVLVSLKRGACLRVQAWQDEARRLRVERDKALAAKEAMSETHPRACRLR